MSGGRPALRLPIDAGIAVDAVPVTNARDGSHARGHARRNGEIASAVMADPVSSATLPFGRIVRSDALAFVQSLPDRSVSLVLSSPPYLWKRTYGDDPAEVGRELTMTAYLAWTRRLFAEFARVLRPDGWNEKRGSRIPRGDFANRIGRTSIALADPTAVRFTNPAYPWDRLPRLMTSSIRDDPGRVVAGILQ